MAQEVKKPEPKQPSKPIEVSPRTPYYVGNGENRIFVGYRRVLSIGPKGFTVVQIEQI